MWFWDLFRSQKRDVIRWENPEDFLLVKKWERPLDEIKDDSSLIVDPWLAAILVENGIIEAVQTQSGKWSLQTDNIPVITSLKNIMSMFESHDKAAIYFVKMITIANQKWWTKNPIKYLEPTYNFPVQLRAFGNFSFVIKDVAHFWTNFVSTKNEYTVDEMTTLLTDRLLQTITDVLAQWQYAYTKIDAKREEIASTILAKANDSIGNLGIEINDFRLEDINFTEETQQLINSIATQGAQVVGINQAKNIDAAAMQKFAQKEQLEIAKEAAKNEWNSWAMMGAVVGMNMGQQTSAVMNGAMQTNDNQTVESMLQQLQSLKEKNIISEENYNQKKDEILKKMQ